MREDQCLFVQLKRIRDLAGSLGSISEYMTSLGSCTGSSASTLIEFFVFSVWIEINDIVR